MGALCGRLFSGGVCCKSMLIGVVVAVIILGEGYSDKGDILQVKDGAESHCGPVHDCFVDCFLIQSSFWQDP
jgi:hypothetical protein